MNAFQGIATEPVNDEVERTGLLRALERLEVMMASLERALHEDAGAERMPSPLPPPSLRASAER
jgi:hypothetical protein